MLKINTHIILVLPTQIASTEPSLVVRQMSRSKYTLPRFPLFANHHDFSDYIKKPVPEQAIIRRRISQIMEAASTTSFTMRQIHKAKKKNGSRALYYLVKTKEVPRLEKQYQAVDWTMEIFYAVNHLTCRDQKIAEEISKNI